MKTMKTVMLTIATLLTVNTAIFAADDADTMIRVRQLKTSEDEAFIRITNLSGLASATLRIKDKKGMTLYREELSELSYMKKYDFSKLPKGRYSVEVRTKNGVSRKFFEISHEKKTLYFKPGVQIEPDMIKVAFMNKVPSPVAIKLYDNEGRVLYEEKVASQEIYAKGLNVSKLLPGQYALAIVGENYTYTRSVELR